MSNRPVAVGLLLCEQVIIEEQTRHATLVNSFSHRTVERFPAGPFPFLVFAILTDGLGEMPLDTVIYRLDTLEEVYRTSVSFRFTDRLLQVRYLLRVRDCSFPIPGSYQVSLLADKETIAQRKIILYSKETLT